MNLGFFIQTNAGTPQNTKIYNFLNEAIESNSLYNASVFFNDIGFNPISIKFGMFNSSELWAFNGDLICTSAENLKKALSIVNDINIAYLFNSSTDHTSSAKHHVFDFANIARQCKVIVDNLVDYNTFYRLTGTKPHLIENWSMSKIGEIFSE